MPMTPEFGKGGGGSGRRNEAIMYQPGEKVWLSTTAGEMLARLIDPDSSSGIVVWLVEVDGGPRLLAMERDLRTAEPIVVEGWAC